MDASVFEPIGKLLDRLASDSVLMSPESDEDWQEFSTGVRDGAGQIGRLGCMIFEAEMLAWLELMQKNASDRGRLVSEGLRHLRQACDEMAASTAESDACARLRERLAALSRPSARVDTASDLLPSQRAEIPEFISNAEAMLDEVESRFVELEKNRQDAEQLNTIFRVFHTLKGEAGLLGLRNFQGLAHEVEGLLEKVRSGRIVFDPDIADAVLSAGDCLKNLLKKLRADIRLAMTEPVDAFKQKIIKLTESKMSVAGFGQTPQASKAVAKVHEPFAPKIPVLELSEGTEIITEFISESKDHLSSAEEALLVLENAPENAEEISKIFRAFHTIKGLASFLNLEDMRLLTHETETMMDLVRKKTLSLNPAVVDGVLAAIDSTRKLLDLLTQQVGAGGQLNAPYHDVTVSLEAVRAIVDASAVVKAQDRPVKKPAEIELESHIAPEVDLSTALDPLKTAIYDTPRIGNALVGLTAEEAAQQLPQAAAAEESIKIGIGKLDSLIDMTGELVITWSQLAQNPEIAGSEQNKLIRDRSQLAKIVRDLQTVSMSMRLIPIKPAFQKMVRLIRDLSKKTGKEVEVELVGEETEVDKSIVELIVDPLMHMVRNSVDHGIETKAVRLAAGKPAAGKVRLSAYHKGGSIVIEVSDDGGGLNRERILKKAWERGLIPMNEEPPDSRIYAMIFEPGFSTAEKVTDVSGRGVGMDVVKRNIDKLRGRIDIETQAGSGSTFVIRLPLTLAMIDGLIFQVGRERYVAPLTAVLEMVRPSLAQIVDVTGKGKMIKVRENLYQLVSLAEYFGVPGAKSDIESMTACLMESDFGCVCLLVDEVIGQQQVVIKNLGERLKDVKGQAGGTILGDGRVGLILDINGIVRLARGE